MEYGKFDADDDNILFSDTTVLRTIGERCAQMRVQQALTQADLAKEAGVSKRTVERLENGDTTQITNLIRVLRVLKLLGSLVESLPEKPLISVFEQNKLINKQPKRGRSQQQRNNP